MNQEIAPVCSAACDSSILVISNEFPMLSEFNAKLREVAKADNHDAKVYWSDALANAIGWQLGMSSGFLKVSMYSHSVCVSSAIPNCGHQLRFHFTTTDHFVTFTYNHHSEAQTARVEFPGTMGTAGFLHTVCGLMRIDIVDCLREHLDEANTIVALARSFHVQAEPAT